MDQHIRFCAAPDGVRLAYATAGQGYPLVKAANWLNHLEFDWESPIWAHLFTALAANHTLIRYDERGTGLSDREVDRMSFEDWVSDLETVVDAVGQDRFALLGISQGGPVAIAYAARHPERVSHLILYGALARWPPGTEEQNEALALLVRQGWGQKNAVYRQIFTSMFIPNASAEQMRWFNELEQRSASPETAVRILTEIWNIDVREMAACIAVPTLILHCHDDQAVDFSAGRELAALVPGARFVPLEGSNHYFLEHEPARGVFLREVNAFLGTDVPEVATVGRAGQEELADATIRPATSAAKSFASGRYVVRRTLGEGGQKTVYLVHDAALDRECALSVIKRDLLEPDDLPRLQREAQSMARLGANSTVVTIFDIGDDDGTPYIVCEYVPGGDLSHELRAVSGPLPLDRALAIATDVAEALAIAHAHGVVHRDIKPSNVWLCENGSAKLGDFGLAFSLDRSRLTMPGTFLGTALYMPPEQALGHPAEPRSDLYSLGAILYEMVAGAPPFVAGDALSVISQHVNVTPVPPTAHNANLPPALDALILRLLAKSPDERPASASEVVRELRRVRETAARVS